MSFVGYFGLGNSTFGSKYWDPWIVDTKPKVYFGSSYGLIESLPIMGEFGSKII
jgi:hypothetical protein